VVAVASDAHNLGGRQPRMTAAAAWLEAHYGKDAAWKLVLEGPASVCQPEPPVKALPAAESWDVLSGHYVNTLPPDGH
jgi:protein-tyrosine phosphatase